MSEARKKHVGVGFAGEASMSRRIETVEILEKKILHFDQLIISIRTPNQSSFPFCAGVFHDSVRMINDRLESRPKKIRSLIG